MKIYYIFGIAVSFAIWTDIYAISCYDCNSDTGNCNEGECEGKLCVRTETASLDTNRKIVIKSCSNDDEVTECYQIPFGSQYISRCICDYPMCNGDKDFILDGDNNGVKKTYLFLKFMFLFLFLNFIIFYYFSIF